MKKKVLCVIMAMIIVMQGAPFVFAKNVSEQLDVNVDLAIRQSETSGAYVNGPLEFTAPTVGVDVRATLEMANVFSKFIEWYEYALGIIDNMVKLDKNLVKADLVNELNSLKINGEFVVKAYFPKALVVPEIYTDGTLLNMNGFNSEAKEIFYEKSRTLDTSDGEYNVVTITIGVTNISNPNGELFVGDLYSKYRARYLNNITFTAYNVYTTTGGLYTFKGTLDGYTSTNGTVGGKEAALNINYTGVQKSGGQNPAASDISVTFSLNKPTYSISGEVVKKDEDGNATPIANANVKLKEGNDIVHEMNTDETGHYGFEGVPVGIYHVVVEYDGTIKTKLVTITDSDAEHIELVFVEKVTSILDFGTVNENTATIEPPKASADNINKEAEKVAEAEKESQGAPAESVEVKMTISAKEKVEEDEPATPERQEVKEVQTRIEQEAVKEPETEEEPKTILDKFFEIVVEKTVKKQGEAEQKEAIKETETVLHVVIPYNMNNKRDIKVYRDHDGLVELFKELASLPGKIEDYIDGTVYFDKKGGYIHLYSKKFSMYAITYVEVEPKEPVVIPDDDGRGSSSSSSSVKVYEVAFNVDGNTSVTESINNTTGTLSADKLPVPVKEGYTFDGWYLDSEFKNKVTEDIKITADTTLYGHFVSDTLDTENHFAYIIGYPDGTVRPEDNITREEVATIFYRLLREEKRLSVDSTMNAFIDVASDRWSNIYISTLANGGYAEGYQDGTFGPENYITRAEFATMASRFANLEVIGDASFTDIEGHWATDYILKAANAGWIEGYEDGSFRAQNYITRAEAMAIINRMLVRDVDAEGLHQDAKIWSDINESDWYYYIVIEATNAHSYTRQEDGKTEKWQEIAE